MDVDTQALNIWIALGTLSGVGIIVAFIRTWAWFSKSGKEIIDLPVRLYFLFLNVYHFLFHRHLVNFYFIFSVFSVLLFFLSWQVFQSGG
jgi:hypothetical protein